MRRLLFLIPIVLVIFSSCQDGGGLLPDLSTYTSRDTGLVDIPGSGTVLVPGETLTIQYLGAGTDSNTLPDTLDVTLELAGAPQATDGARVFSSTRKSSSADDSNPSPSPSANPEVTASPPPVSALEPGNYVSGSSRAQWRLSNPFSQGTTLTLRVPASFPQGLYTLGSVLSSGETVNSSLSAVVFVEKKLPEILDVQVYPGVIKVGNDGLIQARIRQVHSEGIHIRWRNSEGVLGEQDFVGDLASLQFKAPLRKGVYTYILEVYPRKPLDSQFGFDGPVQKSFSLVVSDQAVAGPNDLEPAENYPGLLHFNGDLEDQGVLAKDQKGLSFNFTGKAGFRVEGKQYGYELGAGSFISDESNSAFVARPETQIAPFGMELDFTMTEVNQGRIFSTRTGDGKFALSFELDSAGYGDLSGTFGSTVAQARTFAPLEKGNLQIFIAAAVVDGYLDLLICSSGEVIGRSLTKLEWQPEPDTVTSARFLPGQTWIGAASGPRIIIDEMGIFLPPDTPAVMDPYILAMEQAYGNGLVLSRTFMAPYLKGLDITGDVRIANGKLIMPAGSSVGIPARAALGQKISFSLLFTRSNRGSALVSVIPSDTAKKPVMIDSSGFIRQGESRVGFEKTGSRLEFSIDASQGGKNLVRAGNARFMADLGTSDGYYTLSIQSSDALLAELELDTLLGVNSGDL